MTREPQQTQRTGLLARVIQIQKGIIMEFVHSGAGIEQQEFSKHMHVIRQQVL